jgi:hypothetical protein
LATEVAEVIGADGEIEHLVEDGEKISQGANRAQRQSMGGAEEATGGGERQLRALAHGYSRVTLCGVAAVGVWLAVPF